MDKRVVTDEYAKAAKEEIDKIIANIETVIKGKHDRIELIVLALLAGGHVLIEDIPGVGKTSLVSALARTIDCNYSRIQFTPDVMPSDVTGFSIYNQKTGQFEFRKGAAMSNIVLADEINRASAKTQSAMLEIMEERQVTVDSVTYKMESPFIVLATQNPIESLGTYKLPEAQIDRFMIKTSMGYPNFEDELSVIMEGKAAKKKLSYVTTKEKVVAMTTLVDYVEVSMQVASYILSIVRATREHPLVKLGSSPRGSIALLSMARAYALSQGKTYVEPDDIKYLAPHVLSHRLMLTHGAKTENKTQSDIIKDILHQIIVPE